MSWRTNLVHMNNQQLEHDWRGQVVLRIVTSNLTTSFATHNLISNSRETVIFGKEKSEAKRRTNANGPNMPPVYLAHV